MKRQLSEEHRARLVTQLATVRSNPLRNATLRFKTSQGHRCRQSPAHASQEPKSGLKPTIISQVSVPSWMAITDVCLVAMNAHQYSVIRNGEYEKEQEQEKENTAQDAEAWASLEMRQTIIDGLETIITDARTLTERNSSPQSSKSRTFATRLKRNSAAI